MIAGHRGVFIAEFDDDYQVIRRLSKADLVRRWRCYFLVAPQILLHPAYTWQSQTSNELIVAQSADLARPPFALVMMGDSTGWNDYMRQRIDKLKVPGARPASRELASYDAWGATLEAQGRQLDQRFPSQAHVSLEESRDSRFRRFLRADLRHDAGGGSLRAVLDNALAESGRPDHFDSGIRRLRKFVRERSLVSVETVANEVAVIVGPRFASEVLLLRRLLTLYYQANVDERFELPQLPTLLADGRIASPYDPDVFWEVMEHVFGPRVYLLASDTSSDTARLLRAIREDPLWDWFRETYLAVIEAIDSSLRESAENIAERLRVDAGYVEARVLPRLWRTQKTALVVSAAGVAFSAPAAASGLEFVAVASASASTLSAVMSLRPLRRIKDEFDSNRLQQLRVRLRRDMRILVRSMRDGTAH